MTRPSLSFEASRPLTVGCIGAPEVFQQIDPRNLLRECDLLEIRLDATGDHTAARGEWRNLPLPLLFTARRGEEGGHGDLPAETRADLLAAVLEDASAIDVEIASAGELAPIVKRAAEAGIPVVWSAHHFGETPDIDLLRRTIETARTLGGAVAKIATFLRTPADLARLASLLDEDHGIPLSLMGMGPIAPASRLLLAQLGSVLNYGYLGNTPTAPGQWSAARLKEAIASVERIPRRS